MIVCICQGISEAEIKEAIDNGADTVLKVCRKTKAGTICGSCRPVILEMLDEEDSVSEAEGSL